MSRNYRKGQSIVEYTLLLAVVILAVVVVLNNTSGVGKSVNDAYTKFGGALDKVNTDLPDQIFGGKT